MDHGTSVGSLLEAGLKACGHRGRAIASNLANLNTPGYRRYEVNFKKFLAEALRSADPTKVDVELIQPKTTEVRDRGNDVDLDMEVGDLIKNSALHKTYMRIMATQYRQMELAMRGNT
jgi:flagellar basal-body rod protein FlgB